MHSRASLPDSLQQYLIPCFVSVQCERTAKFDHDLFKRGTSLLSICSQTEESLPFLLEHEVVDLLARSFDRLLSTELKDPSNGASMLRLCNAVEDLAEHQQGDIFLRQLQVMSSWFLKVTIETLTIDCSNHRLLMHTLLLLILPLNHLHSRSPQCDAGKIACGSFFIPRIVRLVTSEMRDVPLLRAAAESLSALIILSPNNQQLLFELTESW